MAPSARVRKFSTVLFTPASFAFLRGLARHDNAALMTAFALLHESCPLHCGTVVSAYCRPSRQSTSWIKLGQGRG